MNSNWFLWISLTLAAILIAVSTSGLRVFARAIAFAEGYGVPGAIPTVRNNPGDLKLPSSGGAITTFASAVEGWAALYRQLDLIVTGRSNVYTIGMTIGEMARRYTATEQTIWTGNVVKYLQKNGYPQVTAQTPLRDVLL